MIASSIGICLKDMVCFFELRIKTLLNIIGEAHELGTHCGGGSSRYYVYIPEIV